MGSGATASDSWTRRSPGLRIDSSPILGYLSAAGSSDMRAARSLATDGEIFTGLGCGAGSGFDMDRRELSGPAAVVGGAVILRGWRRERGRRRRMRQASWPDGRYFRLTRFRCGAGNRLWR